MGLLAMGLRMLAGGLNGLVAGHASHLALDSTTAKGLPLLVAGDPALSFAPLFAAAVRLHATRGRSAMELTSSATLAHGARRTAPGEAASRGVCAVDSTPAGYRSVRGS
jgi:hypothetical protein